MATGILKVDGHLPNRISVIDTNGISHSLKRLKDGEGRVLWQDAPLMEWVDLGNSTYLFGDRLLGTDAEHPYGKYYAWGELTDKDSYTEDNYELKGLTQEELINLGYTNTSRLINSRDVVNRSLGFGSMMEYTHLKWLIDNTIKSLSDDGKSVILTSTINGNSIMLPLAGQIIGDRISGFGTQGRVFTKSYQLIDGEIRAYIATLTNSGSFMKEFTNEYLYRGYSILPVKTK